MIQRLWQWAHWCSGFLFFLLYAATAAPSISELFTDSLEFQLTPPTFGIAHMTGYPLYTLLGGVWSRLLLPIGNWAWRMNLLSALAAALCVALLFRLAQLLSGGRKEPFSFWCGAVAVLCFGLGPVWWQQATIAEVYTLHNLFVTAILLKTLEITECEEWRASNSTQPPQGVENQLRTLFLLLGLSLTHHRTTLLLLPAIAIYLWLTMPRVYRPQREWGGWLAAILLPLLLYLYLPIRAAWGAVDLNGSYKNTIQGFWDHILARGYAGFLSANPLSSLRSVGDWLTIFRQEMGWVGLLLTTLGAIHLVQLAVLPWRTTIRQGTLSAQKRRLRPWLLIFLVALTNLLFALNYHVADVEVFLLPVFLCLSLFSAIGVVQITHWQAARQGLPLGIALFPILACFLLLPGFGKQPWPINRSHDWAVHDYAVAMASVDFPANSQVIGLEGQMTAIKYMQQAVGLAGKISTIVANDEEARRQALAAGVAAGKAVYLTRELPGIESMYSFSGEGPLVRVWPLGQAEVGTPQVPLDVWFAEGRLHLIGYDLLPLAQAGTPAWRLALYWRPIQPLAHIYKVSLRWLDGEGTVIPRADGAPGFDEYPLRQVALTPSWPVDQTVRDVYDVEVALRATTEQPARMLLIILYEAENGAEAGSWQIDLPAKTPGENQ